MCRRTDGETVCSLTMLKLSAFLVTALLCFHGPEVIKAAPTNVVVSTDSTSTHKPTTLLDVSSATPDGTGVRKIDDAVDLILTTESRSKVFSPVATSQRNVEPVTDFSKTLSSYTSITGAPTSKTAGLNTKTDFTLSSITTKDFTPKPNSTTSGMISTKVQTTTSSTTEKVPFESARAEFLSANEAVRTVSTTINSVHSSTYGTSTSSASSTIKTTMSIKPKLTTDPDSTGASEKKGHTQTTAYSIDAITVGKGHVNRTTIFQGLAPELNGSAGSSVTSNSINLSDNSSIKTTVTTRVANSEKTTVAITTGMVTLTNASTQSSITLKTGMSTEKSVSSDATSVSNLSTDSSSQTNSPAAAASNQVTKYGQPAIGPITDSVTFEIVDPNNFSTTDSGSIISTTLSPSSVSDTIIDNNKYPDITDIDSASGDGASTVMTISPSTENITSTKTAAINTTIEIKTQPIAVPNNSTASLSSTTSVTTTSSTIPDTTSSSEGQTAVNPTDSPSVAPTGDGGTTAVKGINMKSSDAPKPLTLILIAVSASLLALLIILCVVTYVKFRKKSRSIRKRLTVKDDAIYDNPIYHGRWEVPKAPEPTSSSCPRSLPMLISALPDEVLRLSKDEDTGFHLQFMMLNKLSPALPQQAATSDVNITKNRYRDILPFDHNRVKLDVEQGLPDYINASYVPGVKSEREYIVSQGPLERTAPDHWRMIWELKIRVVAMLTTCEEGDLIFKSKCCQYWPNKENESVNFNGIYVTLVSTARLCRDNYKLKVLHIRKGKDSEPRKVQLFQYIKWPDRKNPDDPEAFLEYRDHVRQEIATTEDQIPVLVHCSAGVGRTGTFIVIDTLLQHMEERESVDVYGLVLRLRRYRVLLVQNVNQYKFVHSSLLIMLDKLKKAEIDEGRKRGLGGSNPYENMVMGQRAVVGELGGLVHGGEESDVPLQQSSAVQNFLRKTKTNAHQPNIEIEDDQCRISEGMPSPVRVDEWPRPLSDPVPRPVIETPKSRPAQSNPKGDPERALAKELGGMFQGGFDHNASPGKTAAIKAFLRNRDQEPDSGVTRTSDIHSGDSLVIDNRFREDSGKQTTCL